MKYKLLVLDLDGTLTNNKKEITEALAYHTYYRPRCSCDSLLLLPLRYR